MSAIAAISRRPPQDDRTLSAEARAAALFLFFGGAALELPPWSVFDRVGVGQWFRYLTSLPRVGGAALLLWPATTALGALIFDGQHRCRAGSAFMP
jgi:hypothetical protein